MLILKYENICSELSQFEQLLFSIQFGVDFSLTLDNITLTLSQATFIMTYPW